MRSASRIVMGTLFAGAVLVFVDGAGATVHNVQVLLDGLQETPPVATPGTGFADVSFDDVTGQMVVSNGTFQNMIGTSSDAHVHGYAAAGAGPVGVVFGLTFQAGVSTGTFSGSGIIPGGNIDEVMNGLTYINIHSTFRPGGELRGQVIIPEPASGALALVATGTLLLPRRRREPM
jgi:hypothetical protein